MVYKPTRKLKMALRLLKSFKRRRRHRKKGELEWVDAPEITQWVQELIELAELSHIKPQRVICYRSTNANTRAYARIWGLSRIWQQALGLEPAYVIEVISEKFDSLPMEQKNMVLIHELLHIPRTFSGALVPHHNHGGVNDDRVREIYQNIKNLRKA